MARLVESFRAQPLGPSPRIVETIRKDAKYRLEVSLDDAIASLEGGKESGAVGRR